MKFSPAEPQKPVREEMLSEDGCFKLTIDRSDAERPRYAICTEKIEFCPGIGIGETIEEAMAHAKESLLKAAASIRERIDQLDAAMLAEGAAK